MCNNFVSRGTFAKLYFLQAIPRKCPPFPRSRKSLQNYAKQQDRLVFVAICQKRPFVCVAVCSQFWETLSGLVFAVLFKVLLLIEIQEDAHHFVVWWGGRGLVFPNRLSGVISKRNAVRKATRNISEQQISLLLPTFQSVPRKTFWTSFVASIHVHVHTHMCVYTFEFSSYTHS